MQATQFLHVLLGQCSKHTHTQRAMYAHTAMVGQVEMQDFLADINLIQCLHLN